MDRSKVSIVKCGTYDTKEVEVAVKRAVELLGGIEKFVKPGSRVLIKPNLLSARKPEEGVDTHPEVVRAIGRLVKKVTPNIFVGDSPGGWVIKDIDEVYEKSGMKQVCSQEGFNLVKFDKVVDVKGFPVAAFVKEMDSVISVPKLKTHSTTVLTGAVKNTFGMIVGLYKAQCHMKAPMPHELSRILVDVFSITRPTISIMDAVVAMEGEGPAAGDLRDVGLIMASSDAVALDVVSSEVVGFASHKIPTTLEAARRNLGVADISNIDVLGEKLQDVKVKKFKLPKASAAYKLPEPLIKFILRHVRFYPAIDKKVCVKCGLCRNICPKKAITECGGVYNVYIKDCICCFCCYEVCPHKAISLGKSLLAKVILR